MIKEYCSRILSCTIICMTHRSGLNVSTAMISTAMISMAMIRVYLISLCLNSHKHMFQHVWVWTHTISLIYPPLFYPLVSFLFLSFPFFFFLFLSFPVFSFLFLSFPFFSLVFLSFSFFSFLFLFYLFFSFFSPFFFSFFTFSFPFLLLFFSVWYQSRCKCSGHVTTCSCHETFSIIFCILCTFIFS